MKKIIFFIIAIVMVMVASIAYYQFTKTHADTADLEAVAQLSSSQLFEEFSKNEKLASERYVGKIIEVNGRIFSIVEGENDDLEILLVAEGEMFGVVCSLEKNDESLALNEGQEITIKGECSGILSDVILIRCIIKNA
jgi:hypothetical protein